MGAPSLVVFKIGLDSALSRMVGGFLSWAGGLTRRHPRFLLTLWFMGRDGTLKKFRRARKFSWIIVKVLRSERRPRYGWGGWDDREATSGEMVMEL